jgi:enoyl-CoA hydratase/carnithine racemase
MGNRDARSGRLDRNLRVEDRDRVRVLTLDRPDVRNAFDIPLYDAVREALADASVSANIGACVLTGTGPVFSAGMDLHAKQPGSRAEFTEHGFVPFARALATFDKPLLIAVNGAAVGVGLTMLLHADLVLASPAARFRIPFLDLGIVPEAASSLLLAQVVGPKTAADLIFTQRWMDAEEALERGLVWKLCPPADLLDEACAVAAEITRLPNDVLVAAKQLLIDARNPAVITTMEREEAALLGLLKRRRAATDSPGLPTPRR